MPVAEVDVTPALVRALLTEQCPDLAALGRVAGVHSAKTQAGRLVLAVEQLHVALPGVLAELAAEGLVLENLSTHRATLEDVFVNLTGRQLRE